MAENVVLSAERARWSGYEEKVESDSIKGCFTTVPELE